ncbi:MAG: ferrochelatase [Ignavibacteriales bacterium]|nr:ferrochelatase [Ignavibacteriales bacterium]
MSSNEKIAVVLFQLGGPDSLESVEPFLYKLFCDPDIINFPGAFLARRPLAKLISSRRKKIASKHYEEIGGKSPILELTNAQAVALEKELNKTISAKVFVAMRYWKPFTFEAIDEMKKENFSKIILLPLYPQYSKATTFSSFKEWRKVSKRKKYTSIPTASVCCYHNHPKYVEAIVENINIAVKKFSHLDASEFDLVFSAHGVPVSLIKEGDPYQRHIEETVKLVLQKGKWKSPNTLCYQSKVGPAQWLKPSLNGTIRQLAERGRKNLLVIPVAFVTEHIETLHEINIEAREEAEHLGIKQFEMMPALNDSPKFIECLADLVLKKVNNEPIELAMCSSLFEKNSRGKEPLLCPLWNETKR